MDLLYYINPRDTRYYPRSLYVVSVKNCFNKNYYAFNDRINYQFITLVNISNCIK